MCPQAPEPPSLETGPLGVETVHGVGEGRETGGQGCVSWGGGSTQGGELQRELSGVMHRLAGFPSGYGVWGFAGKGKATFQGKVGAGNAAQGGWEAHSALGGAPSPRLPAPPAKYQASQAAPTASTAAKC